jgi:hypothetical protein
MGLCKGPTTAQSAKGAVIGAAHSRRQERKGQRVRVNNTSGTDASLSSQGSLTSARPREAPFLQVSLRRRRTFDR